MENIVIRPAERGDIPGIAFVHHNSWQETYRGLLSDAFLDARSYERSLLNHERIGHDGKIVAVAGGEIVGFAGLDIPSREDPRMAEIGAIYVLKKAQGLGVGRLLFEACVQAFKAKGFKKMYLWVLDSNEKAAGFYNRMGLSADGSVKEENLGGTVRLIRFSGDI